MRILKKARFVVCLIFEPSLETEGVLTLLFGPPPSPVSILESWGLTPAASSSLIYKKSMKVTEMETRRYKTTQNKNEKENQIIITPNSGTNVKLLNILSFEEPVSSCSVPQFVF